MSEGSSLGVRHAARVDRVAVSSGRSSRPGRFALAAARHGWRAGAVILLLALSALGCKEPSPPAPDITPDACKALCSPHQVFSWTANSCVCHAPCVDDDGQKDGGR